MRAGTRRADGTMALERVEKAQADLRRYLLFREGQSPTQIAELENADPQTVRSSIIRGRGMFEGDQQIRLRDAKYESAIENEKIRQAVRKQISGKIVQAVDYLLDGERDVIETDRTTGKVTVHKVRDPEIVSMGIEAATRVISLQERPMPSQTIVNIQNNQGDGTMRPNELSFEERIERIHAQQAGKSPEVEDEVPMSRQVIEATAVDVTPAATEEELF